MRAAALAVALVLLMAARGEAADCSATPVTEGCGTFTWPDGTRYVGDFHGGFFAGTGKVFFSDGSRLEATFDNASPVGDVVYISPDGTRLSGKFQDVSRDTVHPHKPLDYPFWRALFGDQADVVVAVIVGADGSVVTAGIYSQADSPSYRQAALDGTKGWRYLPATIAGQPVKMPYFIDIQFANAY